jgi:hypothetical protein
VSFDAILPRLATTYESGRLVPFIGAGMSVPACTSWTTLVERLEATAGIPPPEETSRDPDPSALVRRANAAVRFLKSRPDGEFADAMAAATIADAETIPPQTQALAGLWWPLVLTTNYDNLFAAAYASGSPTHPAWRESRSVAVVGRSPEDCQRVLSSLSTAGRTLVWAMQGYLDQPCDAPGVELKKEEELRRQLVVGHDEYRRVTYRDIHFRRAFAEVFRQRSLLFLGSGIRESYLQELFGEVLELYGPSTRPHYAIVPRGELDPQFMLARFQIFVVEYEEGHHEEVITNLEKLRDRVRIGRRPQMGWTWGRLEAGPGGGWRSEAELEVAGAHLPARRPHDDACLVVSAGGTHGLYVFSPLIEQVMQGWGVEAGVQPPEEPGDLVGLYPAEAVYAARARSDDDERNLQSVFDAARQVFELAGPRHRRIHMQLLGAGGVDAADEQGAAPWEARSFPERFSFIQIVRAYGAWRRENPSEPCTLVLHVVSHPVLVELTSGRIDVAELLGCPDVRFFAEIVFPAGEMQRRVFQKAGDASLRDVVRELDLSPDGWVVDVSPPPDPGGTVRLAVPERLDASLESLGVVPGSTLHFHRAPSADTGARS